MTASSNVTTNRARRTAHPTLVLLLIAGAQLMVILDATIVNIALPTMGEYFDKNQTSMTWALNAYTLTFGGRHGRLLVDPGGLSAACGRLCTSPPMFTPLSYPTAKPACSDRG